MLACLYSGGKDSTLAIHKAKAEGKMTELLITMISKNDYSYMFHKPNIKFTELQARAMEIPQVFFNTDGEKEKELEDIEKVLIKNKVTALITGAVASAYQKERIEKICNKLNIEMISPLWKIDPLEELKEISKIFNAIVVQVSAEGLDESFLGKRVNEELIKRLLILQKKYGINLSFEGGEAESFVLDAPMFKKKIQIEKARKIKEGGTWKYLIDSAVLVDK